MLIVKDAKKKKQKHTNKYKEHKLKTITHTLSSQLPNTGSLH